MNTLRLFPVILALVPLATVAQGQIMLTGIVATGSPETYNATMIGTALGPAVPHLIRMPNPDAGSACFAVQRVRVQDSRAFASGTVVDVYLPYRNNGDIDFARHPEGPINQKGALPIGRPALLLAAAPPQPGVFRAPFHGTTNTVDFHYDPTADPRPRVAAYAFFETTHARLAGGSDPMWRVLGSVAEAIAGTSDANVKDAADFLEATRLPGTEQTSPHLDDRLSVMFADAAAGDTPYRRALIEYALNSLHYVGYGDRYLRDVRLAATDPNAFPDGVSDPEYAEQPGESGLPKSFRHDPWPEPAEIAALLKRAQSPTVAIWLLTDLDKPADADVKALARFLASPNPDLRWAFVKRLAAWSGGTAPEKPKEVQDPATMQWRREYPGLDAAVAFWKAKLGTP